LPLACANTPPPRARPRRTPQLRAQPRSSREGKLPAARGTPLHWARLEANLTRPPRETASRAEPCQVCEVSTGEASIIWCGCKNRRSPHALFADYASSFLHAPLSFSSMPVNWRRRGQVGRMTLTPVAHDLDMDAWLVGWGVRREAHREQQKLGCHDDDRTNPQRKRPKQTRVEEAVHQVLCLCCYPKSG
jgi:hypothetical protein